MLSAFDVSAAERSARLALMESSPDAGFWTWDPATGRIEASPRLGELLGARPGQPLTLTAALEAMPPEDAEQVRQLVAEIVSGERESGVVTHRVRGGDGIQRALVGHAAAVRSPEGELIKIVGLTTYVTERVESEDRLREESAFWQATIDSLTAHVAVLDSSGRIIALNEAWSVYSHEHQGDDGEELGDDYVALCEQAEDPLGREVAASLRQILAGERDLAEWTYPFDGPLGRRWFTMRATPFRGGSETRVVIAQEDVTDHHEARAEAQMRAQLLDEADAAVIHADLERRVMAWSAGAERMYGFTSEEALGRTTPELIYPDESAGFPAEEVLRHGFWQGERQMRRKDGTLLEAYFRMRLTTDEDGRPTGIVSVSVDVSEQNRARRDLQAANSYLRAVTDSMAEGMFTLDAEGRTVYLNPAAERMLGWRNEEVTGASMHELSHSPRPDGTPIPREECPIWAARMRGEVVRVDDDLFRRKDGSFFPAAYTASPFSTAEGVEGCVVVMADITERKREEERIACDRQKLLWLRRLREALAAGSFELYAQPIVSCATGQTVQRELLLRMHHPDLDEPAAPNSFLPVAEEVGLIKEIDRWVIGRAIEIAASAGEPVELNLSARSIIDGDIIANIESRLEKAAVDPRLLVFEITETALLEDEAAARMFVGRLHGLGCGVALDDFGTGYGTFTYLKRLPVDTVKIDIEFIRDLRENAASAKVVNAVLGVARDFGLKTVAEGVEDEETFELLRRLGVDYAQGYHLGRPAPIEDAAAAAGERPASGADTPGAASPHSGGSVEARGGGRAHARTGGAAGGGPVRAATPDGSRD